MTTLQGQEYIGYISAASSTKEAAAGHFKGVWGDGSKVTGGGFRLNNRKKLFPERVVRPLNRLPRGAVDAPSLEKCSRPSWMSL